MSSSTLKLLPIALSIALAGCETPQVTTANNTTEQHIKQQPAMPAAPIAKKVPHTMTHHGHTRVDDYYWMRDDSRTNPEILSHLAAENSYTDAMMAHTDQLQTRLFNEIKSRIVKDDNSVPVKRGDYYYSSEMRGDNEYPVYVRSQDFKGTAKEILLDVNQLAADHNYFSATGLATSPNDKLLAYGEDTLSRRIYTLKVKNINSNTYLPDEITGTSGSVVWSNSNKVFYYIKKDPQTLLGYQVYRHRLGTPQSEDELVFEETDNTFYTYIWKSKDGEVIYIGHSSTETAATSIIDANNDQAAAVPIAPREKGLEYSTTKLGEYYYINTNFNAVNFRLMRVHQNQLGNKARWQEIIPARQGIKLEDTELFNDHLVYQERENGFTRIIIRQLSTNKERQLTFNDSAFSAYLSANTQLDATSLRLQYTSMTTPWSTLEIDLRNDKKTVLKQQKVLGGFDANNYHSERIFITSRDSKSIPVTLVYRKDKFAKDGSNPLYQYAYGSYGSTMDPSFSVSRLSLLDRGFVYAIAHIRGSQMLGRPWYETGKKLNKQNTFNDFIDVTKGLTHQGYGDKSNVFAVGGSAGGLLMGAIINQAPELYQGVAAHVPFVDVVTTMLDESIPLTTGEYDEWGNPNDKTYYDYMLSYSPYDQVKPQAYPHTLITTGLHDSQVQYFEPAKWVAKLRDYKTNDKKLLFKVDMEAGHGGASGRFKRIKDTALEYAFFIDLINKD